MMMDFKRKACLWALAALLTAGVPAGVQAAQFAPMTAVEQAAAERGDYRGYYWKLDEKDKDELPRNFRLSDGKFQEMPAEKGGPALLAAPSREGLDTLHISASAEFSRSEWGRLWPVLRQKATGPIYVVDLRQESHGYFNGAAVSWCGKRNWGNVGKSPREVLRDEQKRLTEAKGKKVQVKFEPKTQPKENISLEVRDVMTEKELVEQSGARYFRLTDTDHVWPADENIDKFIDFVKKLPDDAWLHFHCRAGKGRTTSYMAMYDMMRNPQVPCEDIISRQYLLGGAYLAFELQNPQPSQWRAKYYREKAQMIRMFYQYVQENRQSNFKVKWSKWLKAHKDSLNGARTAA